MMARTTLTVANLAIVRIVTASSSRGMLSEETPMATMAMVTIAMGLVMISEMTPMVIVLIVLIVITAKSTPLPPQ